MESIGGQGTRNCVGCGRSIPWEANVCPYCGHDYRLQMAPPMKARSAKPVIGGVLIVVAGLLAFGMGLLYLALDVSDLEDYGVTMPPEMTSEELQDVMVVCGSLLVVFAVIAIIGGVFALQRKHFGLAIAGSIFGLLGLGFLIGSLLALVGLILVAISRDEFE